MICKDVSWQVAGAGSIVNYPNLDVNKGVKPPRVLPNRVTNRVHVNSNHCAITMGQVIGEAAICSDDFRFSGSY